MFTFLSELSAILFEFRALVWETGNKSWRPTKRSGNKWLCEPAVNSSVVVFQDGGQEEAKERKESPCVWWKFTQVFSFPFIFFCKDQVFLLHLRKFPRKPFSLLTGQTFKQQMDFLKMFTRTHNFHVLFHKHSLLISGRLYFINLTIGILYFYEFLT